MSLTATKRRMIPDTYFEGNLLAEPSYRGQKGVGIPIAMNGGMNRKSQICTLNLWVGNTRVQARNCAIAERLNRGFSRLQDIQLVRNHRQDPLFRKSIEERIVWRELLELELQDVDEQIERISAAAGQSPTDDQEK